MAGFADALIQFVLSLSECEELKTIFLDKLIRN